MHVYSTVYHACVLHVLEIEVDHTVSLCDRVCVFNPEYM